MKAEPRITRNTRRSPTPQTYKYTKNTRQRESRIAVIRIQYDKLFHLQCLQITETYERFELVAIECLVDSRYLGKVVIDPRKKREEFSPRPFLVQEVCIAEHVTRQGCPVDALHLARRARGRAKPPPVLLKYFRAGLPTGRKYSRGSRHLDVIDLASNRRPIIPVHSFCRADGDRGLGKSRSQYFFIRQELIDHSDREIDLLRREIILQSLVRLEFISRIVL